MQTFTAGKIDAAVIGAGHAGIEAALACARLGLETALFTINLDAVGNMPCNPSIGGTGKGHLVYEIDALGGEMGYAADRVTLQSRVLNMSKGPAVHSKRIQADRMRYREIMKHTIENQPNLRLIQAEIVSFNTVENGSKRRVTSVVTNNGAVWLAKSVIICAGTFLNGRIIIGENMFSSGPDGMLPSNALSASLSQAGISLMRFKTGTPPRIHADSIDFSKLELQNGDDRVVPFSTRTLSFDFFGGKQIPCHIAYTNENTHRIIRDNLHRSPLYSNKIKGTGTRYCPSIEDKIVRFADKERHQLFVEPVGVSTKEIYLQGFSSSMPEEVQSEMLYSLAGFENARVMRSAYAIEYDLSDPTQLYPTLEFKEIEGLYGAGQFNGTSGYEEAASQGLIAGINASLKIKGEEPLLLPRSSSYIGTLIDDLVTKGTNEPYRIMTSRSEYRLLLRQDNADERLCETGYKIGLVNGDVYKRFLDKQKLIKDEINRIEHTNIPPSEALFDLLDQKGSTRVSTGIKLDELMRRPELDYESLMPVDTKRPVLPEEVRFGVEVRVKYGGYIKRQLDDAEKLIKLENHRIPADIDYNEIKGIRIEARQKLAKYRPLSIGQASRISGISPADITVFLIYLKRRSENHQ